jgi:hypothetical protein
VPISSLFVCGYFYFKKMKKRNWVGLKFDMLTITKELANKMVAAVCDCGVEKEYPKARFSTRFRKSCGCHERIMKDGSIYNGILIEKDYVSMSANGRRCIARCHCGNTFEYSTHDIIRGKTKWRQGINTEPCL